ncbi:hypothetical protein [Neolewinella persica]|uniref:hypothetical protein n=1 Tax=Neolewinella persica TaxID=70998 RepID=UPI00037CE101|nr:hypothetical protein [Neolewinella persica]
MKNTYWAGIIAAAIILSGNYLLGIINNADALEMINGSQPTIRFMCSAVMTATATILALLLTILSFTVNREEKLRKDHFKRLRTIAKMCTGTFVASMIGLLLLSIPYTKAEGTNEIAEYFSIIYYVMQMYAALMSAALITIVFMLYETAKTAIVLVDPSLDSTPILRQVEEE